MNRTPLALRGTAFNGQKLKSGSGAFIEKRGSYSVSITI
jgi:hypothetical protein